MKKKTILLIILVLVLAIGLVVLTGCMDKKEENKVTNNSQTIQKNESSESSEDKNSTTSGNKNYEYTYRDGVLTQIVDEEGNPKQTDFVIDGLVLVGNRHDYNRDDTMGITEYFAKQGYKKEGLNKDFYLGEWISFYVDTKYVGATSDVKILVTPHKKVEELEKMSISELEGLATENGGFVIDYKTPEEDNYKYVGEGYVHQDYKEGKYDVLFTYKGKLAYFININETKEPVE